MTEFYNVNELEMHYSNIERAKSNNWIKSKRIN